LREGRPPGVSERPARSFYAQYKPLVVIARRNCFNGAHQFGSSLAGGLAVGKILNLWRELKYYPRSLFGAPVVSQRKK
jgi:hypothetical protein